MPTTSTPSIETASSSTLDCFTGAIVLREGAAAVGSTHLGESTSSPTVTPTPTSLSGPTSVSELPPYFVKKRPFVAPLPVVVIKPHQAAAEAARPRPTPKRARAATPHSRVRAESLPWPTFGAFAVGASVAALMGVAKDGGGLVVAAGAAAIAGIVTLTVALARRRQASCPKPR